MSKKIVIGITDCEKYPNYEEWIKSAADVDTIQLGSDFSNLDQVERCDGILLTGGEDVHPRFYGSKVIDYANAPKKFTEKRDKFEIETFNRAQKNGLPVLGVCRGLQLINCILGGTLKQDLEKLNEIHRRIPKSKDDKVHEVKIKQGTLLRNVSQLSIGEVNSSHHQSIASLGKGLTINCEADNGIIEGIERSDLTQPFLLAVQWHPERMKNIQLQDSPLARNIRDSFLEAARSRQTAG